MAVTDLIERTLAGDPHAFEQIFERYKNLVYKAAYLILQDVDEAEDALQETFLKVYRSLGSYQPAKAAFSTWIYRITVNQCLNQRSKKRLRPDWMSQERSVEAESASESVPFESSISEQQALQQALRSLSAKLRVVLILRFFLDLSYADIAQVLDIPLGTVKSRLNLGLKEIRQALEGEPSQFPRQEVPK